MFYTSRVLFIHMPRSGGTWLTDFAYRTFGASLDIAHLKHAPLEIIYERLPETRALTPFTIVRDHQEASLSYYNLARAPQEAEWLTPLWEQDVLAARSMAFEEYLHSDANPLTRAYHDGSVQEFPYERPLTSVVQWLFAEHEHKEEWL